MNKDRGNVYYIGHVVQQRQSIARSGLTMKGTITENTKSSEKFATG